VKIVCGQVDLVQIIFATHHPGSLTGSLDGRQEQTHQDPDDRDDHQEFNQRKANPTIRSQQAFWVLDQEFHFLNFRFSTGVIQLSFNPRPT
jgi:hypothetical protein